MVTFAQTTVPDLGPATSRSFWNKRWRPTRAARLSVGTESRSLCRHETRRNACCVTRWTPFFDQEKRKRDVLRNDVSELSRLDMNEWICLWTDTKSIVQTHTLHNVGWVKTHETEGFTTPLEFEPQGYRHILTTTVRQAVTLATTPLQSRSLIPKLVEARYVWVRRLHAKAFAIFRTVRIFSTVGVAHVSAVIGDKVSTTKTFVSCWLSNAGHWASLWPDSLLRRQV